MSVTASYQHRHRFLVVLSSQKTDTMSLSIGMLVKMPRSDEENDQSRMNFTKNLRTVSTPAAVVLSMCRYGT